MRVKQLTSSCCRMVSCRVLSLMYQLMEPGSVPNSARPATLSYLDESKLGLEALRRDNLLERIK